MKKFLLTLLLAIPLFLKAQTIGEYNSDSVYVYEDVRADKYDSFKVSTVIKFFKRNDSSFVTITGRYASSFINVKDLVSSAVVDGYMMYDFNAVDMRNKEELLFSIQLIPPTNNLNAVGLLDIKGRLTVFFINALKPKNSL